MNNKSQGPVLVTLVLNFIIVILLLLLLARLFTGQLQRPAGGGGGAGWLQPASNHVITYVMPSQTSAGGSL
jgi:hypothetical protein